LCGGAVKARELIGRGAPVDWAEPESGRTPLHGAAEAVSRDAIDLLLRSHAAVDPFDREGRTPLGVVVDAMLRAWGQHGTPIDIDLLLLLQTAGDNAFAGASPAASAVAIATRYGAKDIAEILSAGGY
jgi:hypothetical protein